MKTHGRGKMEGKKIVPPKLPLKSNLSGSPTNIPVKSPVKSFSTQKNTKPMTSFSKTTAQKSNIVSGGERVQVATSKPINKNKLGIVLIVILLTVLIVASTALILVYPRPSRMSDINIDFTTQFSYAPISVDHEVPDNYKAMPGDQLECKFAIQSDVNENSTEGNLDVFLRVKAYFVGDGNYLSGVDFNFVDEDCWFKGADGYYYYTKTNNCRGVLSPGDKIEISKTIIIGTDLGNEYAGKSVGIMFSAEALQANYQAIGEIWKTAPFEWSYQYRNLI